MKICYWCGERATSKDHIPAKGLFPSDKRKNLHTVPACDRHNEKMSMLDERLKFYIQAAASDNPDALELFKTKTMRSLGKQKAKSYAESLAKYSKWIDFGGQKRLVFCVQSDKQNQYFEKLVRGAYFLAYGEPASGYVVSVSPQFIVPGLDLTQTVRFVRDELTDAEEYPCSNSEIFAFKHKREKKDGKIGAAILIRIYKSVEILGFIRPDDPSSTVAEAKIPTSAESTTLKING